MLTFSGLSKAYAGRTLFADAALGLCQRDTAIYGCAAFAIPRRAVAGRAVCCPVDDRRELCRTAWSFH